MEFRSERPVSLSDTRLYTAAFHCFPPADYVTKWGLAFLLDWDHTMYWVGSIARPSKNFVFVVYTMVQQATPKFIEIAADFSSARHAF